MRGITEQPTSRAVLDIVVGRGSRSAVVAQYGGGDFLTFDRHYDGSISFAIGDVSAKGVVGDEQAMRLCRAAQIAMMLSRRAGSIVETVSDVFYREIAPQGDEYSACVAAGTIDPKRGTLSYAAAGTEAAIVVRDARRHEHLGPTGPLLVAAATPAFDEMLISFDAGDTLLLFTDGVVEARDRDGRLFGTSGLMRLVCRSLARGETPSCAELLSDVDRYCEGAYRDDATLAVVQARATE